MTTEDRADAEQFLTHVIEQAEHDADRVAAFLKANGCPPRQQPPDQQSAGAPSDTATEQRARAFLMNLAAALKLSHWHNCGFEHHLPADLPAPNAALQVAAQRAATENDSSHDGELPRQVLHTWLRRFVRSAPGTLQRDVVLDRQQLDADALLDRLADLLWRHRHLTNKGET